MSTSQWSKSKRHKFLVVLSTVVSIALMVMLVLNVFFVNRTLRKQTETLGQTRLVSIANKLESTIDNDKIAISNLTEDVEERLSASEDIYALADFFDVQSERLTKVSDNTIMHIFVARGEDIYLPGANFSDDFNIKERTWYDGSMNLNPGEIYITHPYTDWLSSDVCYTLTKKCSDGKTIIGMDFSLGNVQKFIEELHSDHTGEAWVFDQEGLVIGSNDEDVLGKDIVESRPDLEGIVHKAIENAKEKEAVSVNERTSTYFFVKTDFDWYMLFDVDSKVLYHDSYIELVRNTVLNLAILGIILFLFINAMLNRSKAERALQAKEEFFMGLSSELRTPVSLIRQNSATTTDVEMEPEKRMENIRDSVEQLSVMLDNLFSYSGLAEINHKKETKKTNEKEASRLQDKISLSTRTGVVTILLFTLVLAIVINGVIAVQLGKQRMLNEVKTYTSSVSQWIRVQENILNQMVYVFEDELVLSQSKDKIPGYLKSIPEHYGDISAAYIASANQDWNMISSDDTANDDGIIVQAYPWYIDAVNSPGEIILSDPWFDTQHQVYSITLSKAVKDKGGNIFGVVAFDIYLDRLTNVLEIDYTDNQYAFLINRSGIIVNHPNEELELSATNSVNISKLNYFETYKDHETVHFIKDYDGKYKACMAVQDVMSGFTILIVEHWWDVYGSIILCCIAFLVLFGICIFAVNFLVHRLIRWQVGVESKLQESVVLANQATKAKSQFLAQMSHEIRTPINAVLGMNEMILRENENEDIEEYATNIDSAGKSLLMLINSILDFSKIEDGHMEIVPVEYQTNTLVQDLYNMTIDRAEKKNLLFQMDIDEQLPQILYGDDVRIRQVIINLLTNAVKYTPKGSVTLKIAKKELKDDMLTMSVSVIDTGIGIREDDMEKLFQSFQRLDLERNHNIEGTGLGISIVSSLLEMMGSKLQVESEYGKGSTFHFEIEQKIIDERPIHLSDANKVENANQSNEVLYAPNATILVVDDNQMNLKVVKGLLKRTACQLTLCNSGLEAIEKIRENHYDVILMDHMMPDPDGIKTLQMMRAESLIPENTIPLVLTANAVNGAREEYINAGFTDFLTKPIDSERLESALMKYLPSEKVETKGEKELKELNMNKETVSSDKFENTDVSDEVNETDETPIQQIAKILDVKTGLQYCMNDEGFYLEVLEEYINSDKNFSLKEYFEAEDYENYRIVIHAVKSTSLTIGAQELSERAKALEFACKNGNYEFVRENHDSVLGEYETLIGQIKDIIY